MEFRRVLFRSHLFGYVAAFLDALGSRRRRLTEQHLPEARICGALHDGALVVGVLPEAALLFGLDGAGTIVDVAAVAVEYQDLAPPAGHARGWAGPGVGAVQCLSDVVGQEETFLRYH